MTELLGSRRKQRMMLTMPGYYRMEKEDCLEMDSRLACGSNKQALLRKIVHVRRMNKLRSYVYESYNSVRIGLLETLRGLCDIKDRDFELVVKHLEDLENEFECWRLRMKRGKNACKGIVELRTWYKCWALKLIDDLQLVSIKNPFNSKLQMITDHYGGLERELDHVLRSIDDECRIRQ